MTKYAGYINKKIRVTGFFNTEKQVEEDYNEKFSGLSFHDLKIEQVQKWAHENKFSKRYNLVTFYSEKNFTLSELCTEFGLDGIGELMEYSGVSRATLRNWYINPKKQKGLYVLLCGVLTLKHTNE